MEENQEFTFNIIPVQDNTGVYFIQNFDVLYDRLSEWVERNDPTGRVNSQEEFDYFVKDKPKNKETAISQRVLANSIKEMVATARKGIISSIMGTFEEQAKAIEKLLADFDAKCKKEKEEWLKKTTNKVAKPTKISLTVRSFDAKAIEKVRAYALKMNCEVL